MAGLSSPPSSELGEELIERLREAVKIRLIADVPLGAFLSGGVDSSAVVALMAQGATEPVNTCSIGFNHSDYDESTYSTRVAERYGTRHNPRQADADDFDLVDRLADVYGEPFADSSAMPTFGVCGLARERVTVALSGDGGDEAFAGYRRYRWHHYEELVRQRLPQAARTVVRCLGPDVSEARLGAEGPAREVDAAGRGTRFGRCVFSLRIDVVGRHAWPALCAVVQALAPRLSCRRGIARAHA